MPQKSYQIKNLHKSYPGFQLRIAELTLYEGEVFCLLGASGAGKTTLLRLLNFLETPDEGELLFDGHSFTPRQTTLPLELLRKVTTVFQRPALLNDNVWNNIIYPLKIRNQRINKARILPIVEQLGISHLLRQSSSTLSGGEAQRVAMARALVFNPQVLLLDEPTANLDPNNIRIIEEMVMKYAREEKPTIVWITHNHFQAKRVGDRICLLEEGRIIEISNKETFFHNPRQQRTKQFLSGEMFY